MRGPYKYLALLILATGAWIYHPTLGGSFIFDDIVNISANQYLQIEQPTFDSLMQASFSSYSGPLRRPVAMFSFAMNYLFTGLDPWWMKLTNLLIHIINACLVWLVLRLLLPRVTSFSNNDVNAIPLMVAGAWLLHPINVTAVAYIVQRMTSLSATFVLLAMLAYIHLRSMDWHRIKTPVLSFLVLASWALGLLSKETGIMLSIYILLIEWYGFGFRAACTAEKYNLRFMLGVFTAPWIGAVVYAIYKPSSIFGGYEDQYFSPVERLLTEGRVVIDYLKLIVIPDSRQMSVYQDNVVLSQSLFSPVSTFLCLLLIVFLLGLALRLRKGFPIISMGILWFFAGHLLESTVYPLEIKFLHRNYLPSIGVLLVIAASLAYAL